MAGAALTQGQVQTSWQAPRFPPFGSPLADRSEAEAGGDRGAWKWVLLGQADMVKTRAETLQGKDGQQQQVHRRWRAYCDIAIAEERCSNQQC